MNDTTLISIRIPVKTAERLDALATALKHSTSFLGAAAIEEYLSFHEWQIQAIEQGIESADAGKLIDHDEVTEWVGSWGKTEEKGIPKCD